MFGATLVHRPFAPWPARGAPAPLPGTPKGPMRKSGDPVKQIVAALTPYLGEHMARSAALAHCQKLGISGPDVSAEQIDKLVDRLQTGLYVFIGREKSAAVMAAIRQTLR